ncbi:hypothetical protein ONZ43_g5139 [Nemania bipapillata]|uniref:Uncharacterized protein n=1 Tax=Nemania bipapillata TaxID=110536 RepID=A0ACC2IEF3_9PEZI|nr:hypothetical protein ONZ43_g5139 [Nemania bipapillata]
MVVNTIISALTMAGVAVGAALDPAIRVPRTLSHAHTAQLDLDFVEEEFKKAGSHSTIQLVVPFASVSSYTGPTNYSNKAINAPINCLGQDTYDGHFAWTDGVFDPNRCADACTSRTQYNLANGAPTRPVSGS